MIFSVSSARLFSIYLEALDEVVREFGLQCHQLLDPNSVLGNGMLLVSDKAILPLKAQVHNLGLLLE